MSDFLITVFGILFIVLICILCGVFILAIMILFSPVLIIYGIIGGVVYLVNSFINLIRVISGKPEKHISTYIIERCDKDDTE